MNFGRTSSSVPEFHRGRSDCAVSFQWRCRALSRKTHVNALFGKGIELFNDGRYFDAHETWEDLWRETHGPEKLLVQALVQSAVALHHASTGNYVGARSVMERSIGNMASYRRHFGGVDVV